jgi:hypothetical protein
MKGKMMTMIKRFLLLFLLILFGGSCYSQDDDFGIWIGIDATHKLGKNLDAELSGCVRTFDNTSKIEQSFLEAGIQYDLNKYFSLSGSYRITSNLENDSKYYFRHKLFLDAKASVPLGNFSFSCRARLQRTTKTYIEDEEDLEPGYLCRLKLKADYNIPSSPLKPYIYCEPFVPVFTDSRYKISKNRISAGFQLRITRKSSLDAGYIFQRDYQPKIADENIVSVAYQFKF